MAGSKSLACGSTIESSFVKTYVQIPLASVASIDLHSFALFENSFICFWPVLGKVYQELSGLQNTVSQLRCLKWIRDVLILIPHISEELGFPKTIGWSLPVRKRLIHYPRMPYKYPFLYEPESHFLCVSQHDKDGEALY